MDPSTQAYFSRFRGLMGRHQLAEHLVSHPRWWTLRDEHGRTALMRALQCKGAEPAILGIPEAQDSLHARDHDGHNLWFHLLCRGRRWRTGQVAAWRTAMWRHGVEISTSPETGRGWIIELVRKSPRMAWDGQVPLPEAHVAWAMISPEDRNGKKSTQAHDELWWMCDQQDAQAYLDWTYGVRTLEAKETRAIQSFVGYTLGHDPDRHPAWLPGPLRQALAFNALLADEPGAWDRMEQDLGQGRFLALPEKTQARMLARSEESDRIVPPTQMRQFLARNRQLQLDACLTGATPTPPRMRL